MNRRTPALPDSQIALLAAAGPSQGHFGRLGIRERLEDFNGRLTIDSSVGQGAKFTVTLKTISARPTTEEENRSARVGNQGVEGTVPI